MKWIPAKQILSNYSSGDNWFGQNYHMNLYKGCSHGCIYCDSRSECYQIEDFDVVRGKENAIQLLEQELQSKRKKGIVGSGGMSDPYNPCEKKELLTRQSLELLHKHGFGAKIHTKSDLVLRDIDILKKIASHSPVLINFTITTASDDLCQLIEPHVSLSSKRFEAIKTLSEGGIYSGVSIWPILPFINDTEENIRSLVRKAKESGANFIIPYFGVTLRLNQRLYYYQKLDDLFPGIKNQYIKTYGSRYECISLHEPQLRKIFIESCDYYGLVYKMEDIVSNLRKQYDRQIQFNLF